MIKPAFISYSINLILFILGAFLFGCSNGLTQKHPISSETSEKVEAVIADNFIGTAIVGKGGGPSAAYIRRMDLIKTASTKELKNLVYHQNPVVSLTSFQGLCERKDKAIPQYLQTIYADEYVGVKIIQGDISFEISTLEYAYGYILGLPLPGDTQAHDALTQYDIDSELQKKLSHRISEFANPIIR